MKIKAPHTLNRLLWGIEERGASFANINSHREIKNSNKIMEFKKFLYYSQLTTDMYSFIRFNYVI